MSTILLSIGVHARNWSRIDPQPLNSILSFIFGDFGGGGGHFAESAESI